MNKLLLMISACAAVILATMMIFTSPSKVGPVGVLLFFTTSYLFFLGLAAFVCKLFFIFRGKMNREFAIQDVNKRSFRYGLVLALAPVMLMLVGSFGGISIGEIVLVVLLEVFLCFLTSRNVI
jgi:hypothetical protein